MRHRSRETAFKVLYQIDVGKNDPETALICTMENDGLSEREQTFCRELVTAVLEHLPQIDAILERNTVGWRVERMMSVDRNLMRLAVYEMLFSSHITPTGAINEALEMAKLYGQKESPGFINSVLDKVLKREKRLDALVTDAAADVMARPPELAEEEPVTVERKITEEEAETLLHS